MNSALKAITRRMVRYNQHIVYEMRAVPSSLDPSKLNEFSVAIINKHNQNDYRSLLDDFLILDESNAYYINQIKHKDATAVFLTKSGRLAHYSFIFTQSKLLRILGYNSNAVLLGHTFTLKDFRHQGLQKHSISCRASVAFSMGKPTLVAETSPKNEFSQRALVSQGFTKVGKVSYLVLLNFLVIRLTKPNWLSTISYIQPW